MTALHRGLAVALAAAATAAGVALSNLEMRVAPDDEALLRLSWRSIALPVERCREPDADELAGLPVHMRQREICEGELASFRLVVVVDDETRIDRELRPAGAREDRPTYVLETLAIPPGEHALEVRFTALSDAPTPPLALRTAIRPAPRDVVLVTLDEEGRLVAR